MNSKDLYVAIVLCQNYPYNHGLLSVAGLYDDPMVGPMIDAEIDGTNHKLYLSASERIFAEIQAETDRADYLACFESPRFVAGFNEIVANWKP